MSMFSLPDGFGTNTNMMDQMMKAYADMMKPVTGGADALSMPAAFMAIPALSAGMIAQFWGAMAGTVQGACDLAHRMPAMDASLKAPVMFWQDSDEDTDAFAATMITPFSFFAGAAKTFMSDLEHTAQDMVVVGEHFAEGIAEDTEAVAAFARETGDTVMRTAAVAVASETAAVEELTAEPAALAMEAAPAAAPVAAAELLPEDFAQPKGVDKPATPDDLKMIAGVGPKLEGLLNGLGIWTFGQVAGWTPNEVAWVDDYLSFKGRINRDDWIAQAAALARGGRDEYVKVFGKEPR